MKIDVRSLLGLGPTIRKTIGKFTETDKEKTCEVHVKKPATLLHSYYFTITFQGSSLGLMKNIKNSLGL